LKVTETIEQPAAVKYKPLQHDAEFEEFAALMRGENVRSYLEIGAKYGGSLWLAAEVLPKGSRIVAVDIENERTNGYLNECVNELRLRGYDAHLFLNDSTDPQVVAKVKELAPFDVCFIDGNHTLDYVRRDWENYGPMARMVAFHDVGWDVSKNGKPGKLSIDVPTFWNKLKIGYRHREIKLDAGNNGIGIIWQ